MRSLTLPLTLAASLIAGAPAFAASSTMPNDTMSKGTMSGGAMPSASTAKHLASNKTSTHVTTGKIKSIDAATNVLTLTNGKKFTLPSDLSASSLKSGERVKISYRTSGKSMAATSVVAAK
ncbi:DUF1344 domain-containing protein [Jiella avicenniae]|uniref:DUF1344 domain-containing protein n=1 Tax=Jiella avicenniae TaxID=2907202 RepID=A0A9X1P6N4_9HYPH|nr:DUF1344 domain-containing protein [Jiella avicenniae]MCE7030749.1 DUF1344 domain-containing protein [Jiella avicenniae]